MEFNPAKPGAKPCPVKGDIFVLELKKLYKEFKTFGGGEGQVMLINDLGSMMVRFKCGLGEFARFAKLFNKTAMENDIPIYIKLERKNGRYYLCYKSEGSGLLSVF